MERREENVYPEWYSAIGITVGSFIEVEGEGGEGSREGGERRDGGDGSFVNNSKFQSPKL